MPVLLCHNLAIGSLVDVSLKNLCEEFEFMETMNRLGKPVSILAIVAIATTGMAAPSIATPKDSLQLAQLVGQCRATRQQIPVFSQPDATSAALRLLSANDQVTLAGSSVDANGFISISTPTSGFVHAINLRPCNNNPPPPTSLCRRVVRPAEGLIIRREPSSASALVGGVAYLGQVTLTTTPATVRRAENRDWVQISAPASGWVSNGLVTEGFSNLAYCQ
jgi:hypothetical protein